MRQRGKIVRPIDLPRLTAATVGVSRRMGDVLNQAGAQWEPRLLANLYASAALEFALGRICNTVEWTSAPTWRRDRPAGRPVG